MATAFVNGATIHYEEMGEGEPIVFIPGGRSDKEVMRPIAEMLAADYRCIIYDRRNCGASDVIIEGEGSDQEIWADELKALIEHLGLGQAYLSGWSAGCRVSLLTAIRHPQAVKGLLLGWVTGGASAAERLAHEYYGQFIEAAEGGGMEEVARTPFFAERIQQNPANRERLLGMDVGEFIAVMRRWSTFFSEGAHLPVIGATEAELSAIAIPTIIVSGDDDTHTPQAAQNLHRLIAGSEFHAPPIARDEWYRLQDAGADAVARVRAERAGPTFKEFLKHIRSKSG